MSDFKIGDRVLIGNEKFVVTEIKESRFSKIDENLKDISADNEADSDYSVLFMNDDDGIKPIKTCYATLGKTGV